MPEYEVDRYLKLFCNLFENEGYKCTALRKNIVRLLFSHTHISVPEIHQLLFAKYRMRTSRPAIYSNIKLLLAYSIVSKHTRHGTAYYELTRGSEHIHLRCTRCNRLIEFKDERLIASIRERCRDYLFYPMQYDLTLSGLCDGCNNDNQLS